MEIIGPLIFLLIILFGASLGGLLYFRYKLKKKKIQEDALFQLKTILTYSSEAIYTTDKDANIETWNSGAEKIFGWKAFEIIGKPVTVLYPSDRKEEFTKLLKVLTTGKNIEFFETERVRKDGSRIIIIYTIIPFINENGSISAFSVVAKDITEHANIESAKNEFISIVSHELRTPLTSIQGSLGLLLNEQMNTHKSKELLNIAYKNSERLNTIINDILDIQKLHMGKFEIHITSLSILEVVRESITLSNTLAEKANVTIIETGTFKDVKVLADYKRILKVMLHLLSNALKFSKTNDLIYVSMQENQRDVRIFIKDQGPGIPEEFWPHVFEKFEQADRSDARITSGTGLGLNISKTIIEHCGGKIGFITEKDKGTTFYFDLPKEHVNDE